MCMSGCGGKSVKITQPSQISKSGTRKVYSSTQSIQGHTDFGKPKIKLSFSNRGR